MCRCISELWLRAFLKLNSRAAPSLSAPALSIYHSYSELNNSLASFFHFSLSLYRHISSISSVWKLFINLSSSASLSLPPICLFSPSDTAAAASPPAYITQKNTPMAFTPSAHTHKHICHISLFHHSSPDPSFAICILCGFVWISTILWKSHTLSLDAPTAGRGRRQLGPVRL